MKCDFTRRERLLMLADIQDAIRSMRPSRKHYEAPTLTFHTLTNYLELIGWVGHKPYLNTYDWGAAKRRPRSIPLHPRDSHQGKDQSLFAGGRRHWGKPTPPPVRYTTNEPERPFVFSESVHFIGPIINRRKQAVWEKTWVCHQGIL